MSDGSLNQNDIDRLLAGGEPPVSSEPPEASTPAVESPEQRQIRLAALWRRVRPDVRVVLERDQRTVETLLSPEMESDRRVTLRGRPVELVAGGVTVARGVVIRQRGRLSLEIRSIGNTGSEVSV